MNTKFILSNNFEPYFTKGKWRSPNSYGINFQEPPSDSGIYFIIEITIYSNEIICELVYVGSSSNLKKRYYGHQTIKKICDCGKAYQFYFLTLKKYYYDAESHFIRLYKPKYNKRII